MIERLREHLIASSLATKQDLEQHLADIEAGRLDLAAFPIVSAWGRRTRGPFPRP
jgi:hypothetical protein